LDKNKNIIDKELLYKKLKDNPILDNFDE